MNPLVQNVKKFVYSTAGNTDHGMTVGLPFHKHSGPGGALLPASAGLGGGGLLGNRLQHPLRNTA